MAISYTEAAVFCAIMLVLNLVAIGMAVAILDSRARWRQDQWRWEVLGKINELRGHFDKTIRPQDMHMAAKAISDSSSLLSMISGSVIQSFDSGSGAHERKQDN